MQLPSPSLVVDRPALEHNIAAIGKTLAGPRLRPHVKAFKSTALARRLADAGHRTFTCATVREAEGMAAADLGDDLLIANEIIDLDQLARAAAIEAGVTLAVDSDQTIDRAASAGLRRVLIDVNVGLPRCGCAPGDAGRLADRARAAGLDVRGVMGYEGHLMMIHDRESRTRKVERAMALLLQASEAVGGDIVSAGGTGTYDTNTWANEIQAGTFVLGDTQYDTLDLPFRLALAVECTVLSTNPDGWLVVNAGLKSFGRDHGNPTWPEGDVMFCSDEHTTMRCDDPSRWSIGDRTRLYPAHLDPTVAKHERMWLVEGDEVIDELAVDLRHW